MKTKYTLALTLFAGLLHVAAAPAAEVHLAKRTGRSPFPGARPFGDPLPGLTAAELAAFNAGKAAFSEADDLDSGLGPTFNNVSCVACHASGAPGGAGSITVTRFGRTVAGQFDPLTALGGSLLQSQAINPACQEVVPSVANTIAHRLTTPLFGLGLIEAIPDATIVKNANHPPEPDGVKGRAASVFDVAGNAQRIGRFGWKAQQATLRAFAGDAYLNEIGITNPLFPQENAPNGNAALLAQFDAVADPEDAVDPSDGKADIDRFADFMRFIAPLLPQAPTASSREGKAIFQTLRCTACHTPSMTTGPSPTAALNFKDVPLYSDLLLHDMGPLGDGIAQGAAGPTEMRTAPLWGLRVRNPYLHDGRAATVDAAIRLHEGEGRSVRDRYTQLSPAKRQALLDFLNSL
jgi:CxxC motif-containing protein (DUF1111 family)